MHTHTGANDQRRDTGHGTSECVAAIDRADTHHSVTDIKIGSSTVVISDEEHRSKLLTTIVVSDGCVLNEKGE